MSSLAHDDDDFAAAAGKNLNDADALMAAGRFDGAGYLAGYVVECSLKSLVMVEALGPPPGSATKAAAHLKARGFNHKIGALGQEATRLASIGTSFTAKYLGLFNGPNPRVLASGWKETIRYSGPGIIGEPQARQWLADAGDAWSTTVAAMLLDGVITQ